MNAGAQYHADLARQRDERLADIIAEHDCSLREAARMLGIGKSAAARGWQRVVDNIGVQAA